jgi:hypothetical protein
MTPDYTNKSDLQSVTSSVFSQTKAGLTTVASTFYNKSDDIKRHKNMQDLTDGIVGIHNISYYCYLNAFM